MSTELRIDEGDAARLEAHRLSAAVLSEVHARPFTPIETPRRVLRLQTTIEGLSVAAISYYIVGLFGYPAKGAHDAGVPGRRFACHHSLRAGGSGAHLVDRAPHPPAPCGHGPD
jgi:hypothetical protein